MNQQRIIELWDKANFLYYHSESDQPLPQFIFAELIVRECVKVVDGMVDPEDSDRYFWAIQNVRNNITKYFGVKE